MSREIRSLKINGVDLEIDVAPGTALLSLLRDQLGLRGSKKACGRGECGACTVLHGEEAVASCVMLVELVTEPIRTIEYLAGTSEDLRARLADAGGFQCGFCTPGQVVRGMALDWSRIHDERDLRMEISGNICRCTGYMGIVEALISSTLGQGTGAFEHDRKVMNA